MEMKISGFQYLPLNEVNYLNLVVDVFVEYHDDLSIRDAREYIVCATE